MGLNKAKISFFNDMVGQAALGFGVSKEDVKSIGDLLESTFNIQCGLPTKLTPSLDPQSQGFCFGKGCKVGKDRVCLKTLGKTVSNPNLPPCDPSNTSTPPPIAYTSPYTEATTPLSTSNTETTTTETTTTTESISLFAIETQPSEYSTTYSAYPTASPQFDICTNRPYISNIPIFSSGMKVGINALVLFFSVVLVL